MSFERDCSSETLLVSLTSLQEIPSKMGGAALAAPPAEKLNTMGVGYYAVP
jgi:hypothetical protein